MGTSASRAASTAAAIIPLFILTGVAGGQTDAGRGPEPGQPGSETMSEQPAPVLTLEQCLAFALENNRELRDANLSLDIADKQIREAWGEVLPTIDASLTYTRNLTDQRTFLPARIFDPSAPEDEQIAIRFTLDNLWNTTLSLEQPLFRKEAFVGVGAAGRYRALQVERARGTAQQVVTRVRNAYYAALLGTEDVRLIEESLRRVEQTLNETRGLNRAGLASSYDVLRLEVEYGNLEPNLRRVRNLLAEAERALKIAMGLDVKQPIELAGSLRTVDFSDPEANDPTNAALLKVAGVRVSGEEDLARLIELQLRHRSELRATRLNTRLAEAQLAAERATLYPALSAFANYQLNAQDDGSPDFFGERSEDRTGFWQAGLRLELPIFSGFQRYNRIAQRRLAVKQRTTEEKLIEQQGANEVQTALEKLLEALARVDSQRRAVRQARRGFEIATAEYREGLSSQLRVTDAEVALRQSEFNYSEAIFDVLVAQASLDAAVGIVPMVDTIDTVDALDAMDAIEERS